MELRVGEYIKYFREKKGMSLRDLVDRMGVSSPSAISNWELGTSTPDLGRFLMLCFELNVTPTQLLGYKDSDFLGDGADDESGEMERAQVEKEISKKFWALEDDADKQEVLFFLNQKYEEHMRKNSEPVQVDYPLFIGSEHPDYIKNMQGCKELQRLRRKNHVSYEAIMNHLARLSPEYDNHLCLGYIILIIRGKRCPATQLYERIHKFLSESGKS